MIPITDSIQIPEPEPTDDLETLLELLKEEDAALKVSGDEKRTLHIAYLYPHHELDEDVYFLTYNGNIGFIGKKFASAELIETHLL